MTHRYVGLVMGLLMLLWFLSGMVMLFVRWPEVRDEQRAAGLAPIPWAACCRFGETPATTPVERAAVEAVAGRPVLRLDHRAIDLSTGRPLAPLGAAQAREIAEAYARAAGVRGPAAAPAWVTLDQWTVALKRAQPFWRVPFTDPARTDIYVAVRSGQVVQVTDRPARILSWLGPIPHWIYPTVLRADAKLWTQVVVWASMVGTFLTLTGLYLGVAAWRPRVGRLTPFRGLMAWHHLAGLAAGLLTLTWVFSGLASMNPWGWLESGPDAESGRLTGPMTYGGIAQAISAAQASDVAARRIEAAPLGGRLYLMADGRRLDATARPAPLGPSELAAAVAQLGPHRSAAPITAEDAYYFGHHEPVVLPAWRVVLEDGVRLYLDPASGQVLRRVDGNDRAFRWWHEGLHRLDFVRGFDRGPGWAAAMLVLLAAAGLGVATGVWLGFRRAGADLERLFRRKTPKPG